MLAMSEINNIRKMYFNQGKSVAEIQKETGRDRKTIDKYLVMEDFNNKNKNLKKEKKTCPKLDKYKETIDLWMDEDKIGWRKQRRCAMKIWKDLKEEYGEEFDISYRTVAKYYKHHKSEIYSNVTEAYIALEHSAKEAQVDFGKAIAFEKSVSVNG